MNDIDFIRKCCEFADGFWRIERASEEEYFVSYTKRTGDYFDESDFERIIYPLLLQRTIEGINLEGDFEIIQHEGYIDILTDFEVEETFSHNNESESIDSAKRSALEYIFQELEG